MNQLDSGLATFVAESRDLLEEMESGLLSLQNGPATSEVIDGLFRAAHTIKGAAGLFELTHVVTFTHAVETVLDEIRKGKVAATPDLVALLLLCCDHIRAMVEHVAAGHTQPSPAISVAGEPLVARLGQIALPKPRVAAAPAAQWLDWSAGEAETSALASTDAWHISLRFGRDVLEKGVDPIAFLRHLETFGKISALVTLCDADGLTETMNPEACYLGFELALESAADKATLEQAFALVRDDCRITMLPPHSLISEYLRLMEQLPEGIARLGEILTRCGSVTERELELALKSQTVQTPHQRLGTILVDQGAVTPAVVDAALAVQASGRESKSAESRSLRVDAAKLDHLVDLVGELIIAAARTDMVGRTTGSVELQECTSVLSALVQEVRDSALQLRMVKIGSTFNRFQRVVYDVSRELGKDITLAVSGEETELDKTVIEKISDPLMHLVRNAIDHGIEPAETRLARGKPAKGVVRLNAYHDSGSIVIEVSDDGGGLNRDRILAKAIERGLVEPDRSLSDREIFAFIFEAGFSTADKVTNLSGRGVGMDVVKRNITAVRGAIDLHSEEGVGTTITIRMPLTLAIINGFLVGLGGAAFVIPLDMIDECLEFTAGSSHDYAHVRGQLLPFVRLRDVFSIQGSPPRRESIVVVNCRGRRSGLVVDALLGEFQTVIKPLDKVFNRVKCIGGSTILGNGDVALILDVPALVDSRMRAQSPETTDRTSLRDLSALVERTKARVLS